MVVTSIFPDGKISRPRLAVFAFSSQNQKIATPSTIKKSAAGQIFFTVVDLARIGLAPVQCECTVIPLNYRP